MGELGTLLLCMVRMPPIGRALFARYFGAIFSFSLDRGSALPVEFIVFLWDVGFLVRWGWRVSCRANVGIRCR